MKVIRIACELNGKKYTFNGKQWFDSSFIIPNERIIKELNKSLIEIIDFDEFDNNDLIEFATGLKAAENNNVARLAFEEALRRTNDVNIIKDVLPRYTSVLRKCGESKGAIAIAESYINDYGNEVTSGALFTSIAAAYVDIAEHENDAEMLEIAEKKAGIAYSKSKGNASQELYLVYERIKAVKKNWKVK